MTFFNNTEHQSRSLIITSIIDNNIIHYLTLFRMGAGGAKRPPTSFSPVTSTNVGISPQNFMTFTFNLYDRLV